MADQNQNYAGKIAFITGAANGIGRTTAIAFAKAGAHVAVVDLNEDGVAEVVAAIEAAGAAPSASPATSRRARTSAPRSTRPSRPSAVSTSPSTMRASSSSRSRWRTSARRILTA